ncbi:MAG: hypothetical protein ACXVCN_07150 [Bdellovibrio sp.]
MSKWRVCELSILIFTALSVGCTDVNPNVSVLKSVNSFEFMKSQITTTSLFSIPLQASCSSYIQSVEMSFDGSNWITLSAYDSTVKSNCDTGSISISLSNSKAPWNSMTFSSGQDITVKFRALPRVGPYVYRDVTIKYVPSPSFSQEVLAGAQVQTGNGMNLRGRVRSQNQQVASGGSFKIRGRILR